MTAIVETLENWDGSLDKADALYHLQRHISKVSGYKHLSVSLEQMRLSVSHPQGQLLVIDFASGGREVVGRCRHFGINQIMLEQLKKVA